MVWVVENDSGARHCLLAGKEVFVGRKDAPILVEKDLSISRKHAIFKVTHTENNLPTLTIKDCSKFGTFVNGAKVGQQTERALKQDDRIKLGQFNTEFKVRYEPLVVTTSCLDADSKKELKTSIQTLGGHVINEWRKECQLLVMNSITASIKVICALANLSPIVTPAYFKDLIDSYKNNSEKPHPDRYLPPVTDSQLDQTKVSFSHDKKRRSLFAGMIFIFLTPKQFKKLSLAVELAGGTPVLMEEGTDDNKDDVLVAPNTCVMHSGDVNDSMSQMLSQNAQDWITHVLLYLKRHKKRPIPDSELGYAVLHCTRKTYCNPDHSEKVAALPPYMQTQSLQVVDESTEASQIQHHQKPPDKNTTLDATARDTSDFTFTKNTSLFKTPVVVQLGLVKEEPASQKQEPMPLKSTTRKRERNQDDNDAKEQGRPNKQPKVADYESCHPCDVSIDRINSPKKASAKKREYCLTKQPPTPDLVVMQEMSSHPDISKIVEGKNDANEENDICEDVVIVNPDRDASAGWMKSMKEVGQSTAENSRPSGSGTRQPREGRNTVNGDGSRQINETNADQNEIIEPFLPSRLIQMEYVSLVVKRNQPEAKKQQLGDTSELKGKAAKNFKKFRKNNYVGDSSLPRIIGGRDLAVYDSTLNEETNDLFRTDIEEENEQMEMEEAANELFEYKSHRNSKSNRSRKR